ncbi:MAG: flagellar filament capping protein FliD, partial [Gemmatimonadetes bacterium]|nr:flagellar filament capping protein FliD [Gemmatimonadota bacterium]
MEPVSFFSGISSGIDFRSLVDEIMRAKQRPADLMRNRITGIEARSQAYAGLRDLVATFRDAAKALSDGTIFGSRSASFSGFNPTLGSPIHATASAGAATGTYSVEVLQKATAEKLAGSDFASSTAGLGLSGEFFVNGARIEVIGTDSLADIATQIRTATNGGSAVDATVLATGADANRLVLTAEQVGEAGVDLVDGSEGVLRSLGLLDASTTIKHGTSNGAKSDGFDASDVGLSTQLGFLNLPPISTVTIGLGLAAFTVDIDLSSDTLEDLANKISAAASSAGSAVTATVVQESSGPQSGFRLDIDGTTAFADSNGVLEMLGVLEGGRGSVAQELQGSALEVAGSTPASAGTLLSALHVGGVAANVQAGDTLTIAGTRGDGTALAFTYTVGATDTLQDVLDRLNSSTDGLQAGSRTATASISAGGELSVVDDESGVSQLSLSIVANNEGGGTLDFGPLTLIAGGRSRQVQAGADALVNVNGALFQRASNTIEDAIPDVTLDVLRAEPGTTLDVVVEENTGGSTEGILALVEAYNAIVDYIEEQSAPVSEGQNPRPFAGNVSVRSIRSRLRRSLQTSLLPGAAGGLERLADVGIEIDRHGRFQVDTSALEAQYAKDPVAVERLFSAHGRADTSALNFLAGTDETTAGTYEIDVTQVAQRASRTGSGFGGTYVDDGTADTITVTDLSSGGEFTAALTNGMTLSQVTAALNAEFETARAHQLTADQALFSDATGTRAGATTTLDQLHSAGGVNYGVADGDTITISGTRSGSVAFSFDLTITDASTQTLGDLLSQIDAQFGSDASLSATDGVIVADANQAGASQISLALTSDNAGGGTLSFGSFDDTVIGRSAVDITATDAGGELRLEHGSYGASQGFDVRFTAGGADGTGSLGFAAGAASGQNVEGTIGGLAATGQGRVLTGGSGTTVDGLAVEIVGTGLGALGNVTFSHGIASIVEQLATDLTDAGPTSIDALADR